MLVENKMSAFFNHIATSPNSIVVNLGFSSKTVTNPFSFCFGKYIYGKFRGVSSPLQELDDVGSHTNELVD